jgi:predicted  nucleic acid-binding Zn-ribbon protein
MEMPNKNMMYNMKKMENDLHRAKDKIKDIYNRINKVNNEKSRDELVKEFKVMINQLKDIQDNCNKLDNFYVADDFFKKTDDNTFSDFEKETYESLIFMAQILRGNVEGLNEFKEQLN